ncbi:MAG: response regulator [Methylovirgula sp.]
MIVEDDFLIRELVDVMIQGFGHQTLSASDVDEALSILRSSRHIDILFSDIYLKTTVDGGCELARQAVRLRPGLRVLYTTGNSITDKMKDQFIVGSHFLAKPYTPEQLRHSVVGLLAV